MKLWERASHKKRANHKKGVTKPMAHPTPIQISKRTAIVVALALLATLVLVLWAVPSVLQRRAKRLASYARRTISTQQSALWLPTAES